MHIKRKKKELPKNQRPHKTPPAGVQYTLAIVTVLCMTVDVEVVVVVIQYNNPFINLASRFPSSDRLDFTASLSMSSAGFEGSISSLTSG